MDILKKISEFNYKAVFEHSDKVMLIFAIILLIYFLFALFSGL